jgi:prepilin-type N-terminal cleavage/methylation domain-containing protein
MQISIKGVTLLELLSVLLIIAILVALALPRFSMMKERALDKEAKANLKLLQAAEKIYRMEYSAYISCADNDAINSTLRLFLPKGDTRSWDYTTTTSTGDDLDARATRYDAPTGWDREFKIDETMEDPCCVSGDCPPDIPPCS